MIPSVNKGKYAWQRAFSALFVLFALTGASPPAPQKKQKSLENSSLAGARQFCRSSKCGQTRKDPKRILAVLSRGIAVWAYFCPSKPCLSLSTDGTVVLYKNVDLV